MLERYKPILGMVKWHCRSAHIAGGAVRDTLLERPIKDIDLFLSDIAADKAAAQLRSQFGYVKVGEWTHHEMFSDPAVARVIKFEKADETIPLCLIGLNPEKREEPLGMELNLARFDFGICMAGWDGEEVYTAPEFKCDAESKTFTLTRADNQAQFNYSFSRFEKMTADRYSGWKLVVPAQFEELAKMHALRRTHYYDCDVSMWMPKENHGTQQLTAKAR